MDSTYLSIGLICFGMILKELLRKIISHFINWTNIPIDANKESEVCCNATLTYSKLWSMLLVALSILPSMLLSYLLYSSLQEVDEVDVYAKEDTAHNLDSQKSGVELSSNEKVFEKCLILPSKIDSSFTSIGGLQKEIKMIKRSLLPITEYHTAAKLHSSLMQAPSGILLFGPPGCGKTLMAKALAKEIGIKFMNIKSSDIKCCMYGKTEARITAMFTFAEKIQPVILFIDEIDSLLRSRSNEASNELSVTRGIKNLFMQHMDGLLNNGKKQVVVVGATNRKEDIDPAILRRMHPQIFIDYPSIEERKEIFRNVLQTEQLDRKMDFDVLANETNGFSGSEIRDVCKTAALNILEEVVHDLKYKCMNSKNKFDSDAHRTCNQIMNDVLINVARNKHEHFVTEETIRMKDSKNKRIDRPFTTDDILKVVSEWRKTDADESDRFPMYI